MVLTVNSYQMGPSKNCIEVYDSRDTFISSVCIGLHNPHCRSITRSFRDWGEPVNQCTWIYCLTVFEWEKKQHTCNMKSLETRELTVFLGKNAILTWPTTTPWSHTSNALTKHTACATQVTWSIERCHYRREDMNLRCDDGKVVDRNISCINIGGGIELLIQKLP